METKTEETKTEEVKTEIVETSEKPVRWKITATVNGQPFIWKRYGLTMEAAKEVLTSQFKEWYGDIPCHIIECEKDKTKSYEEWKAAEGINKES